MDPKSKQKSRDNTLTLLNAAIEAMNLAKEVSSVTPAKVVFGSVGLLLGMIRVHLLLFCDDALRVDMYPGLDGEQNGLRRAWAGLRRRM